ncbi:hypothetical protein KQI86_10585 [Clostridium sp. MSJ-11]|uniref:ABC transporter permease n=1 Tax=Clostridium mobile TaxID=2841512 RepID=A0ABS6EJC7_9CLOT|nr:hypothetical protein [Clostridium mobile]MBU5484781.1 hypothetical protein [Clostridium mobile]
MGNLIKYEIKGYIKDVIGLILVILFFQMLLLIKGVDIFDEKALVIVFVNLIAFGSAVITLIWNIKLFSKDIYEDTSYLIYTIPKSTNVILGSKFIASFIQFAIVFLVNSFFVLNYFNITFNIFEYIREIPAYLILLFIVNSIAGYLSFLAVIYFSITLGKVATKKIKVGKVAAWIIFLITSIVLNYIQAFIIKHLPDALVNNIKNITMYEKGSVHITYGLANANIISIILSTIIFIILFFVTSYLLREKLDL